MAWPTAWTDELRETVRKMWGKGYTASEIADHLDIGVSRNSIIGLCHRHGYARPASRKIRPAEPPPPPRKRPLPRKARPMDSHVPPVPPPPPSPTPIGKLTIFQLLEHHCRWPTGDSPYTFCGDRKRDGSSYCGDHYKKAHHA